MSNLVAERAGHRLAALVDLAAPRVYGYVSKVVGLSVTVSGLTGRIGDLLAGTKTGGCALPTGWNERSSPETGLFWLAERIHRKLPTCTNEETREYIHPSVFHQKQVPEDLKHNRTLRWTLLPLEIMVKSQWAYSGAGAQALDRPLGPRQKRVSVSTSVEVVKRIMILRPPNLTASTPLSKRPNADVALQTPTR